MKMIYLEWLNVVNKTHKWTVSKVEPETIMKEATDAGLAAIAEFLEKNNEKYFEPACFGTGCCGILICGSDTKFKKYLEENKIGNIGTNILLIYNDIIPKEHKYFQNKYIPLQRKALEAVRKVFISYGLKVLDE